MTTVIGPRPPSEQDEPADGPALPELEDPHWMHRATELAHTGFWAVARRLPALVREAVALAWATSRRDTLASIGLNVAAGVLTTLGLLATTGVLHQLFAAGPTPDRIRAALPALALAAAAVTVRGALTVAAGWAQARLIPQINYAVELRLFETTSAVELAAFDDAGFAEEMVRARDRGLAEAGAIVNDTVNLVTGVVGVAATAAAVTVIHPLLLPCLLVAAAPEAATAVRMARRQHSDWLARITRRRRKFMLGDLMADRHTAGEVRAYQMREFLLAEFHRVVSLETRAELRLARSQTATRAVGLSATGVAAFGLYAVLGLLLLGGVVALAAAATALLALQSARAGLRTAVFATNSLYEDALYYQDYRDFLDRARQRVPTGGTRPVDGFDRIELDGVSLRYPDTETPAVDEVSLTVRRGEVIALVGENGSGKTTLAKLVAGLYRPSAGVIRWDGVDAAELDPRQTAAQVAVMSQDWSKFPFTARQNIRVGRHDRPADRPGPGIEDAARDAAAHDMITELPFGYDTLLDRQFKDGQDLSGGQWQRLVAARGLYRDARLLICDEPSAALDARAEHALFQHLRRHPDRAVVLITHRLANVRHADRIFVLDHGRIVQEGDHDELMAQEGLYRELFQLQAAGYLAQAGEAAAEC
ncbi:ABC transporter ATP-binding protein [Micromonospora chaiyaphumensis]|uniref:ATP-binding cassette, subfamily B n=1 Tax=Micromonospora chaiyaphumensis TaxID=307119 RepID=A0A1C4UKB7_9ACTN|nr:ATP-binding cassette domain-containing protein [Micromonospora chaiyaphumensis]SCE72176.1 ATP-binding cassette, subfamily B [Micromonospora chaiyaphumensis]